MGTIRLTAYKIGPSSEKLSSPKVVSINPDQIKDIRPIPSTSSDSRFIAGTTKVLVKDSVGMYCVYESKDMINAAISPTNLYALPFVEQDAAAHGNSAATGKAITKYLTEINSATATNSDGCTLPTAAANKVHVIINNTAVALEIWPNNASDTIGDDSGATAQAAASVRHYVAEDSVNWIQVSE